MSSISHTIHLIRRPDDPLALEAIDYERKLHPVTVILIQDGVLSTIHPAAETLAHAADVRARGTPLSCKQVGYPEICRLIEEAVRVVVW